MDYGYSALISEVQNTNELLETTNTYLEIANTRLDNLIQINFTIGVLILACMCWKLFRSAKRK